MYIWPNLDTNQSNFTFIPQPNFNHLLMFKNRNMIKMFIVNTHYFKTRILNYQSK